MAEPAGAARAAALDATLRSRRDAGRKLLVPYVTGGLHGWQDAIRAAAAAGADAVEVGIPFSDPVMDGPVIQEASERALRAGARGYIMKEAGGEALLAAIRQVLRGEVHVSPRMSARLLEGPGRNTPSAPHSKVQALSDREFEIFQLIGQGLGTREIAGRLNVSIKTIEAHRAHLKSKLGTKDAPGLVREAIRWVESQSGV